MRAVLAGIGILFAGFIVMAGLGGDHRDALAEAAEFGECAGNPGCEGDAALFFVAVACIAGAGAFMLYRGARGDWDSRVRPEDVVGPKRPG
ncbi:MAG: hypothetical protein MPI95_03210 [Nitrosopumilus sp.]|nr:hypothetical protein [Nitrosopumilus sp.]MDA7940822.1 hypothetical protein [Nitrosopumilus sp.]MDA7943322.1 hypothetical protein [Nitrosopumilus sp.]MDA7945695.1 hypothetical protein [Nitrosopumilus sp.]MDA7952278.1 hypothetical protein [Nitrosopumilus sp.]